MATTSILLCALTNDFSVFMVGYFLIGFCLFGYETTVYNYIAEISGIKWLMQQLDFEQYLLTFSQLSGQEHPSSFQ